MRRHRCRHHRARRTPSGAAALAVGLVLAGCGASHDQVDPGFPPANPRTQRATVLLPVLSEQQLRISVPSGWQVALLSSGGAHRSLVRLAAPCYESISITGSSIQGRPDSKVYARYARPVQGYAWTLTSAAGRLIALLDQYTSSSVAPTRSTVGTAYVPLDAAHQLAVDFGAGIWPLGRGSCSDRLVAELVDPLRATVVQVFGEARVSASTFATTGADLLP